MVRVERFRLRTRLFAVVASLFAGSCAAAQTPAPPSLFARPAYATLEPQLIDLPTVLRLVDQNSPVIGFARARVLAAQAREDRADVAWLPNLVVGVQYNRFDGQTQNQRGEVFGVSRGNLFAGGGPSLHIDTADAYFDRLILRRLSEAERRQAAQTRVDAQLEAVLAYLDLVQIYGQIAVNAATLTRGESMLKFAQNARAAQLSKTAADVNRAQTEVYLRMQERVELRGRAAVASARLARLLLLQPSVDLSPADAAIAPVVLIDSTCTLEGLIAIAYRTRSDLEAYRALTAAANERIAKARQGPLFPHVMVDQQTGGFGGGVNDKLGQFSSRSVLGVGVYWQVQNLGFGNAALTRERRAEFDQTLYRFSGAQAQVAAEVSESAKLAAAKYESLEVAQKAVAEATEMFRKLQESSFNMIGPRAQYDALEPLTAIQQLNQAQLGYLNAVLDFNRAQFRLFAALGYPVVHSQPGSSRAEK